MEKIHNLPQIKLGLAAASRNNFSRELASEALNSVSQVCRKSGLSFAVTEVLVETEEDALMAAGELREAGANALAVLLGNFGPEAPEVIIAQNFPGPVMYVAAGEDGADQLYGGRRDAYCGLLNCSYNLGLRHVSAYIPEIPFGTAGELGEKFEEFVRIARAVEGIKNLKIISFGPRPQEFFACNAPIRGLYDLGVEIEENSELDLLLAFERHEGDPRIEKIAEDMKLELGSLRYKEMLPEFARYELTLLDWMEEHRGSRRYVAFANKCWPAFQKKFGFLPCYVHSRLGGRGIPIGCETDIYGALSEYIGLCVGEGPVTLLDINNSIPSDLYEKLRLKYPYRQEELFIGFHCGNTPKALMDSCELRYKINRKDPYAPETGEEETKGTLEGRLKEGEVSCFRLHAAPDGTLQAYVAQGEILPVDLETYGSYGLFAVLEMERFYRHVLLEKRFPHHSAVVYGDYAKLLYDVLSLLGIPYVGYNQPAWERYPTENPFRRRELSGVINRFAYSKERKNNIGADRL